MTLQSPFLSSLPLALFPKIAEFLTEARDQHHLRQTCRTLARHLQENLELNLADLKKVIRHQKKTGVPVTLYLLRDASCDEQAFIYLIAPDKSTTPSVEYLLRQRVLARKAHSFMRFSSRNGLQHSQLFLAVCQFGQDPRQPDLTPALLHHLSASIDCIMHLEEASKFGNEQVVTGLLRNAWFDARPSPFDPLTSAIRARHGGIVKRLVLDRRIPKRNSSFSVACELGDAAVVEMLLRHTIYDEKDLSNKSLLLQACESGFAKVLELLLQHGHYDFSAESACSFSALLEAAEGSGHSDVAVVLHNFSKSLSGSLD
ncbi:hypothetical protein HDU91_006672 [Kappamyces sp. JEL0680]|nr:hypothetical protein HDU91_006672 [Kappamyces sp. JEL0680]